MQISLRSPAKIQVIVPLMLLFVLGVGTCVSIVRTHAANATCTHPSDTPYQVVPFDTLGIIATKYHVSLAALEANNSKNIPNPDLIFPFELVCIPSSNVTGGTGAQPILPMPVLPNSPYVATAQLDAAHAGIPVQIFTNQIYEESRFVPFNTNGTPLTSQAGAIGIAQFSPGTAMSLGINPADPNASLKAAAFLDRTYLTMYNGNLDEMLAAYNAGPGNAKAGTGVAGAVARCGERNFRSCVSVETENYIHAITGN